MKQIICQKCGKPVSNDFGVTLSFCTNCGEALKNFVSSPTLDLKNVNSASKSSKNNLFMGLAIGAVTTLFLLGGFYIAANYFSDKNESSSTGQSERTPSGTSPGFGSVSASEITEISFSSWRHTGLLYSGNGGAVESEAVIFRRAGGASLIRKKDFDDGKTPDVITEKKTDLTNEQFERLAASIIENDFFNQTDSKERISEGDSTLKVKFSGKEKAIKTSNINKDTAQIAEILRQLKALQSKLAWTASK